MSAINFVVRNGAGNIQRGAVGGESADNALFVAGGNDISLNLERSQIVSFAQDGQALLITLTDGQVIVVQGYFAADGTEQNDLFISSDGLLTEVNLTDGGSGTYYATYTEQDVFGKWSPDDDLYFSGERIEAAVIAPADDQVGMLAAPFLMGLGPLGLLGAGLGALVLGSTESGPTDPVDPTIPVVQILTGTKDAGDVVNAVDHADGVDISGTGTVGATVHVVIGDASHDVVIGDDGTWTVQFTPTEIDTGTYEIDVGVTVTLGTKSVSIEDVLVVDTDAAVTFDEDAVGGNGTVNAVEAAAGTVLTGTTQAGSTVTVIMGSNTYTAVVTGTTWSVIVPAADLAGGEYEQSVMVNAVDDHGNPASTTGSFTVDTLTSVTLAAASIGGNGTVNAAEHAAGITVTGTAQAGASVVVTMSGVSQTVIATAAGTWSVGFSASEVTPGTYDATVTAVATDQAGNTATASGTVHIDTEMFVTVNTAGIETDGVVNFVERADGITLTGTAEAGASVVVSMNGNSQTVTAFANGTWSADFAAGAIPSGEVNAPVTVTATDAAGNSATATGNVAIDTFVNLLTHTTGTPGGDGTVSQAEVGQAITLGGMVEVGSAVNVTLGGITQAASVGANGSWTVTFPGGTLTGGEYTTSMIVTATDRAGNTTSLTEVVNVDTVAGDVTLSPLPIETDDVVNAVEVSDGVLIHGTATPGLTVTVTLGGASHQVLAAANGTWSSLFLTSEVSGGTYDASISASITDPAGNSKTVTDTVLVDTEVVPFTLTNPIAGDDIVSRTEANAGVTVSGLVEVGSTVVVVLGGVSKTVVADGTGLWSASFASSTFQAAEYTANLTATATDRAGNVSVITDTVQVDTIVNRLTIAGPVEGDDMVNRSEAADGIRLTGTVEAGSSVMVTFEGITHAATVATNGNWTVNFTGAEIPGGEYTAIVTVAATDRVGNTRSITDSFAVDTTPPEAPLIESYTRGGSGVRGLSTSLTDDAIDISQVNASGQVSAVSYSTSQNTTFNELNFNFNAPIPNGSHLVMTATDDSGNQTSTLFVLEETNNNVVNVNNVGLDRFDIEAIDLQFAEDSVLTLSARDLESLCANSNSLTIHGGVDDTVNIAGATNTGDTTDIGGRTYDIYSLGTNGGSLMIDESITVVT